MGGRGGWGKVGGRDQLNYKQCRTELLNNGMSGWGKLGWEHHHPVKLKTAHRPVNSSRLHDIPATVAHEYSCPC